MSVSVTGTCMLMHMHTLHHIHTHSHTHTPTHTLTHTHTHTPTHTHTLTHAKLKAVLQNSCHLFLHWLIPLLNWLNDINCECHTSSHHAGEQGSHLLCIMYRLVVLLLFLLSLHAISFFHNPIYTLKHTPYVLCNYTTCYGY